jgi:prevent-host-death family protein
MEQVHAGRRLTVTRRGKPFVRLVPVENDDTAAKPRDPAVVRPLRPAA